MTNNQYADPVVGGSESGGAGASRYIQLSESAFSELATGGGSPDVVNALWASERSRRLVVLRAFLDAAADAGSDLVTPIEDAWAALERVEALNPEALAAVLMHPQVGNWLGYALRRHGGGATSAAPAGHDFGQLHAVALAASAAAGQPYRAVVPLRSGRVMVPRFGMAYFDGCSEWDVAEAATEDGRIWFRHGDRVVSVPAEGGDGPGWWALRRLSVGDDLRLTVWLDDLDPSRDLADPVPPVRLPEADVDRWRDLVQDAWEILVEDHRPLAESLAIGVTSLVPLPVGDGWGTRSASTGDAFGAIMCSSPPDAVALAESLAHEFMHIKLGGLMHLLTMTDEARGRWLYAPWRDDPRPAGGLLQGIYAFFAISAFWRKQRVRTGGVLGDFEYAYARAQTTEALGIALRDGGLTERGRRLAEGLAEEMRHWSGDAIDDEAERLAGLVANGHRAGWRIRHCRPRPADVAALATALDAGTEAGMVTRPSETLPDPEMRHWSGARLGLARRRLVAPDHQARARGEGWGAALTEADLALVAGDFRTALTGFAAELEKDPESPDAWTGLGLALNAGASAVAGSALLSRPELVVAVHRESRVAHTPQEVAHWVGAHIA